MSREFKLPDTGEGIQEAEILDVLVEEGDEVEEGQDVLVVETDKAALELPAPESGVIGRIHVSTGDTVKVGDLLITFEEDGASRKPANGGAEESGEADGETETAHQGRRMSERHGQGESEEEGQEEAPDDEPPTTRGAEENEKQREAAEAADNDEEDREQTGERPAVSDRGSREAATGEPEKKQEAAEGRDEQTDRPVKSVPSTRRLARELGVALRDVTPTGPHGRVTDEDVRKAAQQADTPGRAAPALPDFEQWGEIERKPLKSVRRATAERMTRAWREIPHVTHMDAVAIDVLEGFRKGQGTEAGGETDLSLTAFVVKALAVALREHPRFNTSLDTRAREVVYKHYVNIGVAVATDRGLLVPVVRDVDRKSVLDIAAEISELAEQARNGKLSKGHLAGGTFTVTNVGPLGGRAFTPIINWPEVAILGVGKARLEPIAETTETGVIEFSPRLMLPLCLAFDHRVNDGADAAKFMESLMDMLADPDRFILAA